MQVKIYRKYKGFKTPMSLPSIIFGQGLNPRLKMSLILRKV